MTTRLVVLESVARPRPYTDKYFKRSEFITLFSTNTEYLENDHKDLEYLEIFFGESGLDVLLFWPCNK